VTNAPKDARLVGTFLNATNPDLDAFKAKGHKLVMWHGWSDPALSALASIDYYERVQARDATIRDYFRLFMMPGVLHCAGGPGPDTVDWPAVIADWVEMARRRTVSSRENSGRRAPSRAPDPCARTRNMPCTRAAAASTLPRVSRVGDAGQLILRLSA
jgi:hypothetical protein